MINKILKILSPSGAEDKIREFIKETISVSFDSVSVDQFGNLIAHRSGIGPKICIECGMDSRGIMIVSTEKNKAFFAGVGTVSPSYLVDKKIIMNDKNIGIVRYDGKNIDSAQISDLYLEIDTDNLRIGDLGTVSPDFFETDTEFFANGISDIIGMATVLEAISRQQPTVDLTVLFSAQKRLGGRGIRSFFSVYSFDYVITIDSCETGHSLKSGNGFVISAKDKSAVANPELRKRIESIATENNLKYEILVSDENFYIGNISHGGCGNICGCVCIPTSHKGKTLEKISKHDYNQAINLLQILIKE